MTDKVAGDESPEVRSRFSFWLDGGYDEEAVRACQYHPRHRWWTFRLGDVVQSSGDPDESMTICRGCYVPRCGDAMQEPKRCILPRHHDGPHNEWGKGQ